MKLSLIFPTINGLDLDHLLASLNPEECNLFLTVHESQDTENLILKLTNAGFEYYLSTHNAIPKHQATYRNAAMNIACDNLDKVSSHVLLLDDDFIFQGSLSNYWDVINNLGTIDVCLVRNRDKNSEPKHCTWISGMESGIIMKKEILTHNLLPDLNIYDDTFYFLVPYIKGYEIGFSDVKDAAKHDHNTNWTDRELILPEAFPRLVNERKHVDRVSTYAKQLHYRGSSTSPICNQFHDSLSLVRKSPTQ